jgi:hypothetical protein
MGWLIAVGFNLRIARNDELIVHRSILEIRSHARGNIFREPKKVIPKRLELSPGTRGR